MIDSFKKVIGYYALCYIVKYTPVVGRVVQEKFNKEVCRKPRFLAFAPDIFKTQDMCDNVAESHGHWNMSQIILRPKGCAKKPLKKILCG